MIKKEKLQFEHLDEKYKKHHTEYEYELQFENKELVSVRNQFGFRVEKSSYVWEYFSNKYQ